MREINNNKDMRNFNFLFGNPLHLFRKVLVMFMLLMIVGVGNVLGTTVTLKVWNHSTSAYYTYGTFETGNKPGGRLESKQILFIPVIPVQTTMDNMLGLMLHIAEQRPRCMPYITVKRMMPETTIIIGQQSRHIMCMDARIRLSLLRA